MTTHVFVVDENTFKYHLEYKFAGTGDIFSALVTGKLANDEDLQSAVSYACDKISWILHSEKLNEGKVKSVEIEKYLKYI